MDELKRKVVRCGYEYLIEQLQDHICEQVYLCFLSFWFPFPRDPILVLGPLRQAYCERSLDCLGGTLNECLPFTFICDFSNFLSEIGSLIQAHSKSSKGRA